MKIAVPSEGRKGLEEKVAEHFGKCNTFIFLNEKGEVVEIIENVGRHKGGFELPPEIIKKHNANIVLCKNIGLKAFNLCKKLGIEVFVGNGETVKEMFELWKENKVKRAKVEDLCKGSK